MNTNCTICASDASTTRSKGETRAAVVSIITLITMIAEIIFGIISGSMALLADGIHMGTHALALFITVMAYFLARKLRADPSFSFGTGKVGVLAGYTNAIILGITALFMVYESVNRFLHPQAILFNEAILVAVVGLLVNLACAFILRGSAEHDHGHGHERDAGHDGDYDHAAGSVHGHHEHGHQDSNLKAALLHVVADAMTSVLAISALLVGKYLGWSFLDPAVGLLGAFMILKWAVGLLNDTGKLLLDFGDYRQEVQSIRERLESEGSEVRDIHIWRYSENERSLILTVRDPRGRSPDEIRSLVDDIGRFSHVTVEVCGK